MTSDEASLQAAGPGIRMLAFAFDAAILTAAFALLVATILPREPSPITLAVVGIAWPLTFIPYEAALRGATLGRRLAGLRLIVLSEATTPSFLTAGARAAGALVGGFLWLFFDTEGRAWHDHWSGTAVVIDDRPRPAGVRRTQALALGLIVAWAGYAAVSRLAAGAADDLSRVQAGRDTLAALSGLEELHYKHRGRYTADLEELLSEAESPGTLFEALRLAVDGPTLSIELDGGGYRLKARARDARRTMIEIHGPSR